MTVNELYRNLKIKSPLKVLSGYNGKVLCFAFDPKRQEHQKIGERRISCIWAELRVVKSGFGNNADTILCAFVDGGIEYETELRRKSDAIDKKRSDD